MKNIIIVVLLEALFFTSSFLELEPESYQNPIENLIKGVWAEQEHENASFYISDSLFTYVDSDIGYSYQLKEDTLVVNADLKIKWKIVKCTKDSLLLKSPYLEDVLRLYRR